MSFFINQKKLSGSGWVLLQNNGTKKHTEYRPKTMELRITVCLIIKKNREKKAIIEYLLNTEDFKVVFLIKITNFITQILLLFMFIDMFHLVCSELTNTQKKKDFFSITTKLKSMYKINCHSVFINQSL